MHNNRLQQMFETMNCCARAQLGNLGKSVPIATIFINVLYNTEILKCTNNNVQNSNLLFQAICANLFQCNNMQKYAVQCKNIKIKEGANISCQKCVKH